MARMKATILHVMGRTDKGMRRVAYTPIVWL